MSQWLGKSGSHPLRAFVNSPYSDVRGLLARLDRLLEVIQIAAPKRWESKRRHFQGLTEFSELLNLRAELLVAAKLIASEVEFSFGGGPNPQPDLVLTESGVGIEVTTASPQGVRHLHDELEAALVTEGMKATVNLRFTEQPLRIGPAARKRIIDAVLEAVRQGGRQQRTFAIPQGAGEPAATVTAEIAPFGLPWGEPSVTWSRFPVTWDCDSPLLDRHLTLAEDAAIAASQDPRKVKQAESMPTILVVDLARAGVVWLRPIKTWAERLAQRLPADSQFVGLAIGIATLDSNDLELGLALRPSLETGTERLVRDLASQMGAPYVRP